MTQLLAAIRGWVGEVRTGWNRFWFEPTDPATLGLIRILTGAMLLYTHLVWSLNLVAFFGPDGWLQPEAVQLMQKGSYTWSYFWWLSSPFELWAAHLAALAVFTMFTLGLYTRVTSILSLIAALSYIGRAQGALFGLDQINCMLTMYLAVGPSGDAFSLDRWRQARRAGHPLAITPSWSANLAIRLMQIHMCIIYLFAGTAKLTGAAWWDGSALWMALGNFEYQSMDMTWLADWPRMVNLLTHVTIYWEIFYCALIWPRLTRPVILLLAVPLHLGIAVCLGMVTFGLIMLVGNLAFVSPTLVRRLLTSRGSGQGRGVDAAAGEINPRRAKAARESAPTARSTGA